VLIFEFVRIDCLAHFWTGAATCLVSRAAQLDLRARGTLFSGLVKASNFPIVRRRFCGSQWPAFISDAVDAAMLCRDSGRQVVLRAMMDFASR